jgi:hypothetical protein
MDVVLNRASKAAATDSNKETDYDVVRPVILYKEEDLGAEKDYFIGLQIYSYLSVASFSAMGSAVRAASVCRALSLPTL